MAVASSEGDNLNIGMEHKHTVQTPDQTADPNQTAPSNQGLHDKLFCRLKNMAMIWPKYLSIHCVSRSYCSSNPGLHNFLFYFFKQFSYSTIAISDTTADQTAPSNQGLHDKLFCRFKQTRNYIR